MTFPSPATPSAPILPSARESLAIRIALLVGLCALPLAGLALYFLSTGLHREIAVATRQRAGLAHVRQTVVVLEQAVQLAWSDQGDDPERLRRLDASLAELNEIESNLTTLTPAAVPAAKAGTPPKVHALWQEVKSAAPRSADRATALRDLVSQLHEGIFQSSDRAGLNSGPENEISALTDVVASGLPLHIERLLHMHEHLLPDLGPDQWDVGTESAAAVFARQLEDEDLKRLSRSIRAAIEADLASASTLASFQKKFPPQAEELLRGLRELAATLDTLQEGPNPPVSPAHLDAALHRAFTSAVAGWNVTIEHLDALVADQIGEAEKHRNRALLLAALISTGLLPVAWLYFRRFIRPVLQRMVADGVAYQRAAEAARAEADESTRRLRQTQAALDDHSAVVVVDPGRRILAVNERMLRLSGYTKAELLHQPHALLAGASETAEDAWKTVSRGEVWHGSFQHQAKDGRPFWVDATVFPFLDSHGQPVEFVVIETDVTALVHAREAAETAARAKSQFLAMMSHEIRTPMNGVIGFAHLLAETKLDEQQRDYARTILTSGESLLVIINDILDFSKLDAGRTELDLRPVALHLLVEDVLDLLAAQARAKNLELVYGLDPDIPEGILADGPRLRQILLNLAGNAVKFTAAGHVEIAVTRVSPAGEPLRLAFHVRDTGVGIPPERQDRLFKAFSQVDASIARTYGGTGLGLAISQRLVGLMGGEIAVTSAVGAGSDFHFVLPVSPADVSGESRTQDPTPRREVEDALRGRRILVVDDLIANQRLLERILTPFGARVTLARSAVEALRELDRERFDLAILDYLMPDGDGNVLATLIRQRPADAKLPLILVASVQPEGDVKGLELFDTVMLKPVRNRPFAAAVVRALSRTAAAAAPRRGTSPGLPNTSFAREHPLNIAVVDDNPVNLKVITVTLRSLGYAPQAFSDGASALAHFQEEAFDLILMDVQMLGIDGHEATRRLRAGSSGELNRRTRVIALTAGAMAEERAACLAAGMDDFLAKPVPRAELLQKLAACAVLITRPPDSSGT